MIINFYIKIIDLVKTYTKTAVIPFCEEYAVVGKCLRFGHTIHKIEFPYIHKQVFCV